MDIMHALGDFFLSAWLWHITFDWFHPLVTGIIMFLMMRILLRRKRIPSLLITTGAQCFSFICLYILVDCFLVKAFHWTYEPFDDVRYALSMMNELYASLCLGLVYAIFQSIYFFIGRFFWRYNSIAFAMIAWISNGVGMLLSYLFIRMVIVWHYVT